MIEGMCREIIRGLGLHLFVETGTDMGETVAEVAGWFSDMDPAFGKISDYITTGARYYSFDSRPIRYPVFQDVSESRFNVFSVDIDCHSFENAKRLFDTNMNIKLFHDNSAEFLQRLIDDKVFKSAETIFFLDAHWGKYWPLRDELRQILRLEKFVVVIDDFFVPRRSNRRQTHGDFGFDFYYGRILCWGYIHDLFHNIDVKVYYPIRANQYHRGFVLRFKGYSSEELDFLKGMPIERLDPDDPLHKNPVSLSPLAYVDFHYLMRTLVPLPLLRSGVRLFQKMTYDR